MKLEIEKLSHLFKVLSDPNRLQILGHICQCSSKGNTVNVSDITSCCDVDFSVVSRHLSKLKASGILRAQKEGKKVFYELDSKDLAKHLRALADYLENSNCCK